MWKWIVGVLLLFLILVAGTCYWGIKKLAAGGNVAEVTIKQSPERIFVMLTDPDSLAAWSSFGLQPSNPHKGPLQAGDSLRNKSNSGLSTVGPGGEKQTVTSWVVREVRPPVLFVIDGLLPADSTGRSKVAFTRRDSLVAMGDSTQIFSTFTAPMFSILRQMPNDTPNTSAEAPMGVFERVIASTFRVAMEADLQRLKTRLERP